MLPLWRCAQIKKVVVRLCGLCVVLAVIQLLLTKEDNRSRNEAEIKRSMARYTWSRVRVDNTDVDDEERRLKDSPFIYHPEEGNTRIVPPASQPVAKLVSWYLPWEIDIQKAQEKRWILFTHDPASEDYGLSRPDVKSSFNWTVTYQLDSDFPMIFGILRKIDLPDRDFEALFDKKDREVAWFVSHCPTKSLMEKYAERMRTNINVDIFGNCGNMTCGRIHSRDNDSTECLPMLTNRYKFYLAFENSFCKDYVTEKFFKLFDDVDVIPVVRGGFNYKKYLPSDIYVDSSDFKSPEDLARHLVWLGQNKTEYVAMLKRKSQWRLHKDNSVFCRLCEALHTAPPKYHPDLKAKFNGDQSECWAPPDLGQSNLN